MHYGERNAIDDVTTMYPRITTGLPELDPDCPGVGSSHYNRRNGKSINDKDKVACVAARQLTSLEFSLRTAKTAAYVPYKTVNRTTIAINHCNLSLLSAMHVTPYVRRGADSTLGCRRPSFGILHMRPRLRHKIRTCMPRS